MFTKKFTSRMFAVLPIVILMLALIGPASAAPQGSIARAQASNASLPPGGILIDHNTRDVSQIPAQWIEAAKQNVIWAYGSTSHGTQLWTGAEYLSARVSPPTYKFLKDWWTPPAQSTPSRLRMGYDDGWGWDASSFLNDARERLDAAPQATAFMWSWCGQLSDTSMPYPGTVNTYLNAMQQLESEYPSVTFVYMTGHTDQWSANRLNNNNNIIRQFAADNDKALYDFADIESYLPDGTPYANPNDDCPWCQDWCDAHPGDCPNPTWMGDCAHSHSFNCYLKGQAFWWLSARLAGWSGPTPGTTQTVTYRSVGTNDGYILESTETSDVGGAMNSASTVFYLGDGAADKQYRAILSFNTINLPDNAVITKVILKIRRQGLVGSDPFLTLGKIIVDIRTGAFSNNNILQLTDFRAAAHKNTAAIIYNKPVNNWYSVAFNSSAFPYINKSGVTQFRLRFQIGDNDNGTADYLKFYSGDYATAAARPTLIIEYYVP
jgi:hypothetical protein